MYIFPSLNALFFYGLYFISMWVIKILHGARGGEQKRDVGRVWTASPGSRLLEIRRLCPEYGN